LFEIRFHGRGGQGAVTAALILADAAHREGKYSQKIPFYGGERRGSPVTAYVRLDERPVRITSEVYKPDCIIVLDSALIKIANVAFGLKEQGIAVLNDPRQPEKIDLGTKVAKLASVDATDIAIKIFGPAAIPITSTAMLGAFCKATGLVKLESLHEPIKENFPGYIGDRNLEAAKLGYEQTAVKTA